MNLNCEIDYSSGFLTANESKEIYNHLITYDSLTSPFTLTTANGELYSEEYGKCMFLDDELYYENELPAVIWGPNHVWSEPMMAVKNRVEEQIGHQFQVCVCIYYPHGGTGVDYHSDYPSFGDTTVIASVSLGEEREFHFREKETHRVHSTILENGSLLIMGKYCQDRYEHALPLNNKYKKPRINLTFRKFGAF